MQRVDRHLALLLLAVFAVSAVSVVPVSARNGLDDRQETVATATASPDTTDDSDGRNRTGNSGPGSANSGQQARAADDSTSGGDSREKGRQLVAEERKGKPAKTAEQRKKSCEARQDALNRKIENYDRHATKHLAVFDKIFERVQSFQAEKKLDAAQYDELLATAKEKQAAATTAVKALDNVTVTVDCAASDPAASVATVKAAVQDTKQALKDYRTAIKDVIRALSASADKSADKADSTDENTAGGTGNTNTTTGTETNQ